MKEKLEITEQERLVLETLFEYAYDSERCISFDWIESETKLNRKEVQKACRSLREKGLVEFYRGLMTDDGEVAGSGYCTSYEGRAFLHPCDKCKEYAIYGWWEDEAGLITIESLGKSKFALCEDHYKEHKNLPKLT